MPPGPTTDKEIHHSPPLTPVEPPIIPEQGVVTEKRPEKENREFNFEGGVFIMNPKPEDRATSFFAQPGILAGIYIDDKKYVRNKILNNSLSF